jgi:hypothetical protein
MVVHPPGHRLPVAGTLVIGDEAIDDDGRGGADPAFGILAIPDVAGIVLLVAGAAMATLIADPVDLGRAIGGADRDFAEAGLQRFEQGFAKLAAGSDRLVRKVRNVGKAVEIGDFLIEEITHEEVLGEPDAAELFQRPDALRLAHLSPLPASAPAPV